MRRTFVFVLAALFSCVVFGTNIEDEFGARPLGMGRSFVAVADDGYASVWNPAGMDFFKDRTLTGMFSRLYWGIDGDAIGQGFLSYTHHFDGFGSTGLSVTQLFSNLWYETRVTLGYSRVIGHKFGFGVNAKLLRNQVNLNNATYEPQPGDEDHGIVDPRDDPFFNSYGKNKMGFTADVGMMYKMTDKFTLGLMAANLTQPDMSFASVGEAGTEPMSIRVGASYLIRDRLMPTFDVRYLNDGDVNGKKIIRPHAGVEYWLSGKNIGLRTGINPEEYAFGFSYRSRKSLDLQIDYAFIYPLSDVRLTGATSHKLSATLRFLPPPKPLFDLALKTSNMSVYPQNAIIGEAISVRALVENLGEREVSNYRVSLYYEDPEQGWVLAAPVKKLDETLPAGGTKEVEWNWISSKKGHYQFFASVDDDAIAVPKLHGEIDEIDEGNNTGFVEFTVFPLPEGEVAPVENNLEIAQVTLIREEEPIVPVVFFDPSEYRVDERFHRFIDVISDRLESNPDVNVSLRGFYNTESDGDISELGDKLADNRAKAVRSVMLRFSPEVRDRVTVESLQAYDAAYSRAGKSVEHLDEDKPRAEAENRRTELRTSVKGFESWEPIVFFDKGSAEVAPNALQILRQEADKIKKVMERNPEVIFLIEGNVTNDEASTKLAFDRAYNIKQALGNILGEDFVKRYSRRIFIHGNTDNYADRGKAKIGISGESLIFRPMEGKWAAKDYELQQDQMNFVKIKSHVEAGVDSYTVAIVDDEGKPFRVLAQGTGTIPSGVPWDWRDENGNLINPKSKYYVRMDIKDRLGQRFNTTSEPITVNVKKRQQEVETLIIVQFIFDEDISSSKFLESRVEYIARKFIEKALEPKKNMSAVVSGHTDVIGMDFRNRELSQQRAKKQYDNLRQYLVYLLGLSSQPELDRWLAEHKTTLTYKGYADASPYVITKWDDDKLTQKIMGENKLPEGRTINRRVIIEFFTDKEGEQKVEKDNVPPQSMR